MQGFAWASNYLDWYVHLPGICTLPGYGAHDAEPCTQRASYCTHPSLCIHRDRLWSASGPSRAAFCYLEDAVNGGPHEGRPR